MDQQIKPHLGRDAFNAYHTLFLQIQVMTIFIFSSKLYFNTKYFQLSEVPTDDSYFTAYEINDYQNLFSLKYITSKQCYYEILQSQMS